MDKDLHLDYLINKAIRAFNFADDKNNFSFTSGHLGAILIDDATFKNLIFEGRWIWVVKRSCYLLYELIKLFLFLIIPIKNIGIILRTLLRNFLSANHLFNSKDLAIISLGDGGADNDAYFRPLLMAMDGDYIYIKIVGGNGVLAKNYLYIESLLSSWDLFKFSFYLFLSPIILLLNLARGSLKINDNKLRMTYLIFALREINRGNVVQNKLILKSIQSLLNCKRYIFKKFIYPMEGRSWEKNIVNLFNASAISSIGYIHCILTPRHLSLIEYGFYKKNEVPTLILTPSEMIFELVKKSFSGALIKKGFFLRGKSELFSENLRISHHKILFALTGNQWQSKKIIDKIASSQTLKKYDVIIRLNKNTSTYISLRSYAESLGLSLYSDFNSSESAPAFCFFRSSSVAVDYLKYNCMPIYLKFDDEVSSNIFDIDKKIRCPVVSIGPSFDNDVKIALSKSNQFIEGRALANYYLDQNYCVADLTQLIRSLRNHY